MNDFDPAIASYYARGHEQSRLFGGFPSGPLELARTQELIDRHLDLDGARLRIADVGSGPGAYATWLSESGHEVHLLDPVPLHVDQVRTGHPEAKASVGDARALPWEDGEFDVVLPPRRRPPREPVRASGGQGHDPAPVVLPGDVAASELGDQQRTGLGIDGELLVERGPPASLIAAATISGDRARFS